MQHPALLNVTIDNILYLKLDLP